MPIKIDIRDLLAWLILAIAIGLTLEQFLFDRSFWNDEGSLIGNIIYRGFAGLLKPLSDLQVAPIGFLFAVKATILTAGINEYALKFIPLIGHFLAIACLYLFTKECSKQHRLAIYTAAIYSLCPIVLIYASEVKQYSTDIFCLTLMLWLTIRTINTFYKNLVPLAAASCLCLLLSNVTIIVATACFTVISLDHLSKWKQYNLSIRLKVFALFTLFSVCFGLYYFFFIHDHPTRDFMLRYWGRMEFFAPSNPFSYDFIDFLNRIWDQFWKFSLRVHKANYIPLMLLAAFITGSVQLVRNNKTQILILCLLPILIHLFISSLKLYPFGERTLLYQLPIYSVLFASAIHYSLKDKFVDFAFIPCLIALTFYSSMISPVHRWSSTKEAFNLLAEQKSSDETILFVHGQDEIYYYYAINYKEVFSELHGQEDVLLSPVAFKQATILNEENYKRAENNVWVLAKRKHEFKVPTILPKADIIKKVHFERANLHYIEAP